MATRPFLAAITRPLATAGSIVWQTALLAGAIPRLSRLLVTEEGDDMVVGRINFSNIHTTLLSDDPDVPDPVFFVFANWDGERTDKNANAIYAAGGGNAAAIVGEGDANNDSDGVYGFANGNGMGVGGEGGEGFGPGVAGFGGEGGGVGVVGRSGASGGTNSDGVQGFGFGSGIGVVGHGGIGHGTGVLGIGGLNGQGTGGIGVGNGPGVVGVGGEFNPRNDADGVQGFANGTGVGIVGHGGGRDGAGVVGFGNGQRGPGVIGIAAREGRETNADGVQGFGSGSASGVHGRGGLGDGTGARGGAGVRGEGGADGPGVYGSSAKGHGVIGETVTPKLGGVFGHTTTPGAVGVYGSARDYAANKIVAGAFAGYFDGDLVAVGGVKSAAVPHPDGSHRLLYCVEAPESWFEDFGEGTLAGGHAEVRLDPDFAAVVQMRGYHVFLTPHDADCLGLAVTERRADGFTVRELHRGASNGTFSWRLVAKRKDIAPQRLARIELPLAAETDPRRAMVPGDDAARTAEAHRPRATPDYGPARTAPEPPPRPTHRDTPRDRAPRKTAE